MVTSPLFTIATISYNSERWIRDAIESILASSFSDFELLIADDCSSDRTWDIIQTYRDSRIRAWRNDPNIGEYPNRNRVLSEARGRYFLFIDGDDLLYPFGLEAFYQYIKAFPEAAMFYCIPHRPEFILPVQLNPREVYQHDYFWQGVSGHGFTYTLFSTKHLREAGGLSTLYRQGDSYIKRKIAARYPVVLVAEGITWWRINAGQATEQLSRSVQGVLEHYHLLMDAINQADCPLTEDEKYLAKQRVNRKFLLTYVIRRAVKLDFSFAWSFLKQTKLGIKDIFQALRQRKVPSYPYTRYEPKSDFKRLLP